VVLVILIALAAIVVPLLSGSSTKAQEAATAASLKALRDAVLAYYEDMKGVPVWTTGAGAPPGTTGVPLTLRDLQIQPLDSTGKPVPFYDPFTKRGWRGPYVLQSTGSFLPSSTAPSPGTSLDTTFYPPAPAGYPNFPSANPPYTLSFLYGNPPQAPNIHGDLAFLDGWGNPIVLQWPQTGDPVDTRALYVRLVSAGALATNGGGNSASVITCPPALLLPPQNQRGNNLVQFILTQDR
jgi:type II secretory pathway pseudopilin PulG